MFVLSLCLYALVSSRPGLNTFSVAVHLPGLEDSAWFVGCANASDASDFELLSVKGGGDLDPVQCCALCLSEGSQTAALTSESCLCSSHMLHGLVFTHCFNTSSSGESRDSREEGEQQSVLPLPVGGGRGVVALYRAEGPFLCSLSVSASPHRVQAGETFVVEVCGNLAGSPHQPTGIREMGGLDLSYVRVHFMDARGQSSHLVNVLDDGSFALASDWIVETPGKYEINVRVSNALSSLSSTLYVLVSPLRVLSCAPIIQKVTLQVSPGEGLVTAFLWSEGDKDSDDGRTCIMTACVPRYECLSSTWAAVHAAASDLKETMKQLLVLNLTGKAKENQNQETSTNLSHEGEDASSCMDGNAGMKNNSHAKKGPAVTTRENNNSGCYNATVRTHILVQDPAGKLVLNSPSTITTNQTLELCFSTRAESGVTVSRTSSQGREEALVVLLFNHSGRVAVELGAENRAYAQNKSVRLCTEGNRKQPPPAKVNPNRQTPTSAFLSLPDTVRIYAAKHVYATNADITLVAVVDVPDPVEFIWHFGDSRSARTTSRSVTKRYNKPGRFEVVVVASTGQTSVTSNVFLLEIQRAVKLNRLVHQVSVLQNRTVTVSCRVSAGTNLTFLWSFGDGSSRAGQSTERHVFHRKGEFQISVAVSNLVSSASLSSHVFVVDRPCQPPPVKNMGPLQLQVWRYEIIHLGVTYEDEIDCDGTGGLHYTWSLVDPAGQILPLPSIDTHRQSLTLPAHRLHYGAYMAITRVQVVGSVVYSNYSVRVKVVPSPPVALIQGGTNIFINSRNTTVVALDGQRSYDPDFPLDPLSYSWTCKPVSSISSSCFSQHVATSAPVLTFPVALLKHDFDQFHFTLTVRSGESERSASSEVFLTLTPNVLGKVLFRLPEGRGDQVNWDQEFSVGAWCEDCNVPPDIIQYTWSLYVVNASSRPVAEVPFCDSVDLSSPSTVVEGPSATETVNYTLDSAPVLLSDISSTTRNNKQGEESLHRPLEESDISLSTEYPPLALDYSDVLYLDHLSDVFSEFPKDSDSSADWGFSFPVLEAEHAGGRPEHEFPGAEEGDTGHSTGVDGEESDVHEDEWSHLVDSRPSVVTQEQTLLDLPRDPVDVHLFESYTYTGTSSSLLSVRPFSLRPGSRYMLEVTAESHNNFLGRTQLFFKTRPAPNGVMCQVQPVKGRELHTHFSIFCASGKEDLLYEYSFSVGGRSPRTLYQGRDFQYYFRLPSGDPSDDYKVTVYAVVRSAYGTATRPCPVTVQVQPSFLRPSSSPQHDPAPELLESGLRNLSALVQLGNSMEIRHYVSLLSSILNRLSLDAEANTPTQTHTRSALIYTLCELESSDQRSMEDNICVLTDVVKIIHQVSYASARRVVTHVQTISDRFVESSALVQYNLDYKTLNSLIALLSHTLEAAISSQLSPEGVVLTQTLESDWTRGTTTAAPDALTVHQLAADIHQAASDLMLKYIILHEAQEHRVSTGFVTLYATYQNSTVVSSGSATVYIPVSLMEQLFHHISGASKNKQPPCLLSVLTEFTRSPYTWAPHPTKLSGPVVSLSLYTCGTRSKIHIRPSIHPVDTVLQHPQRNVSSVHEYVLHHNRINYHSFNITQEHLQQSIQFSVVFKLLANKPFPVKLLFRMFDRPTPSMHHLYRIHHWESNTTRITLPPAYLSAAGIGHLALLNAGNAPKHRHLSEEISYSLTVDSSLCLSWDDHQGSWTHHGCRTQQADTAPAVGCSCHQLQPLTVVQHHLEGSHDSADLDPFISASGGLTVPCVLLLFVCLYIVGLAPCKKAGVISEQSQQVHYLPDNSPFDPYLYAVTIHTGLSSAAFMSAKVYIVLYGEDGLSQTRELQVPGSTLFRRNSQDTFVLSTTEKLGPVWGVHIWHDNSGPSPTWYLSRVEVSEVTSERGKGCTWLFVGQCWLAVGKGDGQVEKMLRVWTQGMSFAKMLCLKLPDYLADFHIWISVFSCPRPHPFTHCQRLTVCLLLLLGYTCVNTVIISEMDNQLPFELGMTDVSAVSVTTGVLSVLAVLPIATVVSFLFRWREMQITGSEAKCAKGRKTQTDYFEDEVSVNSIIPESHPSWTGLVQQTQGDWSTKYQDTDQFSVPTRKILENKESAFQAHALTSGTCMRPVLHNLLVLDEEKHFDQEFKTFDEGSGFHEIPKNILCGTRNENQKEKESREKVKWKCTCAKACCGHSVINNVREPSLWCHCLAWALCLLLSLACLVLSAVLGMRFSTSKILLWIHSLFFSLMSCIFFIQPVTILTVAVMVSFWYRTSPGFHSFFCISELQTEALKLHSCSGAFWTKEQFSSCDFPQKPYFEEMLRARQRARYLRLVRPPTPAELRRTHGKRRRDTLICNNLRDLSVCVSMLFLVLFITCGSSLHDHYHLNKFIRRRFVRNRDNDFMLIQKHEDWWKWMQTGVLYKNELSCIMIGEPVVWKMEASHSFQGQASALRRLHSDDWLTEHTLGLKVQFTLYSPGPNLFTSVTLLTERSLTGVLMPSANVQSVRVYHTPAVWDYAAMICQLFFLLLSLLQLCHQVKIVGQQGLMGYCRTPFSWLETTLLTVTLAYYVYYIYHSVLTMEAVELLQRHNYKGHVDVSYLATWEQDVRTLRGVTVFLLVVKCVTLLRRNRTTDPSAALICRSLSSLFGQMISGLILLVALSCVGNLLFAQNSSFSSIPRSLKTLLFCCWGLRPDRRLLLSGYELIYGGVLCLCSTMVWTAVMMSVVSSIVRRSRRCRSRGTLVFTVAELARWIRQKFANITLQQRPRWTENHVEGRTYYLEEFECLIDELLFRLNTFTNSLHHEAQCSMGGDAVVSPAQSVSRDFVGIEMIDETKITDHTDATGHGKALPASHLHRLKLELKILQLLQQSDQSKNTRAPQAKLVVEALVHEEPQTCEEVDGTPKNKIPLM